MGAAFTIAAAGEVHLPGIVAIHNHAVEHTTAIWNETPVDIENRRAWWLGRVAAGFPLLVAMRGDAVLGYGSYGSFRPHDGYRHSVEHSVYVAEAAQGQGIGSALLAALEEEARQTGLHVMLGCIGSDNAASIRLHEKHGFAVTGRLPQVGKKFGRWLDLVIMQKRIGRDATSAAG